MPAYDYVLFDWDGCLAQTLEVWISAFDITYPDFGINPGRKTIAAHFGDWDSAKRFGLADSDRESFLAKVYERVTIGLPEADLYPGAAELLQELHTSGVRIALVTSSEPDHLMLAMDRFDIAKYFAVIVTLRDVTNHKPHPESLELALKKLGGSKERAIMIGDTSKDLIAAKNAEIDSMLFFPPQHESIYDLAKLEAVDPTYICRSFAGVREILLEESTDGEN